MQIENTESSLTPPTPASPLREAQSPEALASISSGSSDNASGKVTFHYKWIISLHTYIIHYYVFIRIALIRSHNQPSINYVLLSDTWIVDTIEIIIIGRTHLKSKLKTDGCMQNVVRRRLIDVICRVLDMLKSSHLFFVRHWK